MPAAPPLAATAFGLKLGRRGAGRTLEIRFEPDAPARLGVPVDAKPIADERDADGGLVWEIASDAPAGYLLWGPRYGENLLAGDGRSVRCRPGEAGQTAWRRLFVAQVLPFAALLQGLEVFHASAVVHAGTAIGILAGSGGGKSTLVAALRDRGDAFLADDVLALATDGDGVIAHAGPPLVAVPGDREALAEVGPGPPSAPLGALFLLDRRPGGPPSPQFTDAVAPRLLLGSTFNAVLTDPARLERQLDICAAAAAGRFERIKVDPATPAATVAEALHGRLRVES